MRVFALGVRQKCFVACKTLPIRGGSGLLQRKENIFREPDETASQTRLANATPDFAN